MTSCGKGCAFTESCLKMRILFIASRFPYPLRYGDQVRGFHHIRLLSRRHEIVLLSPPPDSTHDATGLKALEPYCEEICLISVPVWRRLLNLWVFPFTAIPLQALYLYDDAFRLKAQDLMRSRKFDLIHVQLARMAPVLDGLSPRVPAVLDFIDALSVNMAQRAQRKLSPQGLIAGWESRRLAAYERTLVKRYDRLVISSSTDRLAVGDYANLHVVPNGVDLGDHPFVVGGRLPAMIVFTGTMSYFPNVDAVVWFVQQVLPLVRSKIPEVQFYIVGTRPSSVVRQLARVPGVTVTGSVPSVQEFLSRATIAIAPMQNGSGMQFKVIEAMANGAPFVATPFAMGGLEAIDSEHLLVSKNADAFAKNIVKLLRFPELRLQLSHNARRLVEARYSWEKTVEALESVYQVAVEGH